MEDNFFTLREYNETYDDPEKISLKITVCIFETFSKQPRHHHRSYANLHFICITKNNNNNLESGTVWLIS